MRLLPNPPHSSKHTLTQASTNTRRGPGIGAIPGGGLGAAPPALLPQPFGRGKRRSAARSPRSG